MNGQRSTACVRSSLTVTHPSTNRGRRCLTSVNVPLSSPWSPLMWSMRSQNSSHHHPSQKRSKMVNNDYLQLIVLPQFCPFINNRTFKLRAWIHMFSSCACRTYCRPLTSHHRRLLTNFHFRNIILEKSHYILSHRYSNASRCYTADVS